MLPDRDIAHVALVDLNDQAIGIGRGDFEQCFSFLHWRAEHLAEVAGHHNAVERRNNAGARQLLLRKRQLRFGLANLRFQDDDVAAFVLGERIALLLY